MNDKHEHLSNVMGNFLLDYDEREACMLALYAAKYLACTLQKPEDVFLSDREDDTISDVLSGIQSGSLWPTDIGVCPLALHRQWFSIAHEAIHTAFDTCLQVLGPPESD